MTRSNNTKCWPLEIALALSSILPRGKGAIPRVIGRICRPIIHHNLTTRHGASLPIVPQALDVFVAMRRQQNSWDYWVFRAMNELTEDHDVVFDIGANVGYMSIEIAFLRKPQGVIVHSFEPQHDLAVSIEQGKEINELDNLVVHEVALSNTESEALFGIRAHSVHGAIDVGAKSHIEIHDRVRLETKTLDAMFDRREIDPPSLMKLDVEGYELAILKGSAKIIAEFQPIIIFEVSTATFEFGYSPKECCEFLEKLGDYSFYGITGVPLDLESLRFTEIVHYDILAVSKIKHAEVENYRSLFFSDSAPWQK